MRTILKILTIFSALIAIFLTLSFWLGSQNGAITSESPAHFGFVTYGGLSAGLAFSLGFWGRVIDKTNRQAASRSANFAIISGVLSLVAWIGLSFFG